MKINVRIISKETVWALIEQLIKTNLKSGRNAMLETIAKQARAASRILARTSTDKKNACIAKIADLLDANQKIVLDANAKDIAEAKANGMAPNLVDRLMLSEARLNGIAADLRSVVNLPDPIGKTFDVYNADNGLKMHKQRVPLGVIAVIYEARPNVTMDVASLTLKTGNAVILRGGKETIHSNIALVNIIKQALKKAAYLKKLYNLLTSRIANSWLIY